MLSFGGERFTLMGLRPFALSLYLYEAALHAVVINGGCLYYVRIRSHSTFFTPVLHFGEVRIDLDNLCCLRFLNARRTRVPEEKRLASKKLRLPMKAKMYGDELSG